MTIAIVSMIRDNWGGSEELWANMADLALKTAIQSFIYLTNTL